MEVCLSLYQHHKFINRGFLIGPICPIYGIGGILIMLLLNKYSKDPLVLFIMSILICSILEYSTSFIMEKLFKNRWWDYSNMKFNINGRICLETMIPFGVLAICLFYGLNPTLLKIFASIPTTILHIICIVIAVVLITDLIISFNIIIKLKNISNSIKSDSTEAITKKVKEILLNSNLLTKRLIESFPDMQISNKLSSLKEKLIRDKNKIKEEKIKIKKRTK